MCKGSTNLIIFLKISFDIHVIDKTVQYTKLQVHKTYNETSHLLIYENKISHIYKTTRLTYLHMFWYSTFKR